MENLLRKVMINAQIRPSGGTPPMPDNDEDG